MNTSDLSDTCNKKLRSNVAQIIDLFEKESCEPELALLALLQTAVLIALFSGVSQRLLFRSMMNIYNHRVWRVKARDN